MPKTPNRLIILFGIFCTAFMLQTAHAEQALVPMTTPDEFIIQLPNIDHEALIEQVETLRSLLVQRKQALVQIVADKRPDVSDAVITAIVPGGLLYAGYRLTRYKQAQNKLASVSADIEEYSNDLLAMQSRSAPVAIARLERQQ